MAENENTLTPQQRAQINLAENRKRASDAIAARAVEAKNAAEGNLLAANRARENAEAAQKAAEGQLYAERKSYPVSAFVLGTTGGVLLTTAVKIVAAAGLASVAPVAIGAVGLAAIGSAVYLVHPEHMTTKDYVIEGVGLTSAVVLGITLGPVAFGVVTGTATVSMVASAVFSKVVAGAVVAGAVVAGAIAYKEDEHGVLKKVSPVLYGVAAGSGAAIAVITKLENVHSNHQALQKQYSSLERDYYDDTPHGGMSLARQRKLGMEAPDQKYTSRIDEDTVYARDFTAARVLNNDFEHQGRLSHVQQAGVTGAQHIDAGLFEIPKYLTDDEIQQYRANMPANPFMNGDQAIQPAGQWVQAHGLDYHPNAFE